MYVLLAAGNGDIYFGVAIAFLFLVGLPLLKGIAFQIGKKWL